MQAGSRTYEYLLRVSETSCKSDEGLQDVMSEWVYVVIDIFVCSIFFMWYTVHCEMYPDGWIDGVKGNGFQEVIRRQRKPK